MAFLKREHLIPIHQSTYRKSHSTETAVLKIVSDAFLAADRGDVTILGLLDISAAFDAVDHDILINHLSISFGIRGLSLTWINSYIRNRSQTLLLRRRMVNPCPLGCDVPQGSSLWPVLFLRYTVDVIAIAQPQGLDLHLYADGTYLWLL